MEQSQINFNQNHLQDLDLTLRKNKLLNSSNQKDQDPNKLSEHINSLLNPSQDQNTNHHHNTVENEEKKENELIEQQLPSSNKNSICEQKLEQNKTQKIDKITGKQNKINEESNTINEKIIDAVDIDYNNQEQVEMYLHQVNKNRTQNNYIPQGQFLECGDCDEESEKNEEMSGVIDPIKEQKDILLKGGLLIREIQQLIIQLSQKGYTVKKFLGKGGQASVYLAHDKERNGDVALKVQKVDNDLAILKKEFEYYIQITAHVNIIEYYKFFQLDVCEKNDFCVFVFQYCDCSLYDEIQNRLNKAKYSDYEKLKICFDLINGLVELSLHNIVHLDIKPQNILKTIQGDYIYTDFGASQVNLQHKPKSVESEMFTKKYASPEQTSVTNAQISFPSDVYSLGKTLLVILDQQNPKDQKIIQMINEKMIQSDQNKRIEAYKIPSLFLDQVNHQQFLYEMERQMLRLLDKKYDDSLNLEFQAVYKKEYYLTLIKLYNKIVDDDKIFKNVSIAYCYDQLGDLSYEQDLFQVAFNHYVKALEYRKKLPAGFESFVAFSMAKMGDAHLALFRHSQSENNDHLTKAFKYFKDALEMILIYDSEDVQSVIGLLNQIGSCYFEKYEVQTALNLFCEAYDLQKSIKQDQEEGEEYIEVINNMIVCYEELGNNQKVHEYQEKFDKIQNKLDSRAIKTYHYTVEQLGELCYQQGDYDKALSHFQKALYAKEKGNFYSKNQIKFVKSHNFISMCYRKQNKPNRALKEVEKSIEILNNIPEHVKSLDRAFTLNAKGSIYMETKKYEEAINLFEEAYSMRKELKGEESVECATILNNLAICYSEQQMLDKALSLFEQCLKIKQKIIPYLHREISSVLNNIGLVYYRQGKIELSQQKLEESLMILRKIHTNENNPDIAETIHNIGNCYYIKKQYEKALSFYKEALQKSKQLLVHNHQNIVQYNRSIQKCYKWLGQQQKEREIEIEIKQLLNSQIEDEDLIKQIDSILKDGYDQYDYEDIEKAINQFELYLDMKQQMKDKKDYQYALCLIHLGICYKELKPQQILKSIQAHLDSNDILKKDKQSNNDEILVNLLSLSELYKLQDKQDLYQRTVNEQQEYIKQCLFTNRYSLQPKQLLKQIR